MDKQECTTSGSGSCKLMIVGAIFLAIALVLTLYTQSSMGILGLFIAGAVFCKSKSCGNRCCCCCDSTSSNSTVCHIPEPKKAAVRKKTKKAQA